MSEGRKSTSGRESRAASANSSRGLPSVRRRLAAFLWALDSVLILVATVLPLVVRVATPVQRQYVDDLRSAASLLVSVITQLLIVCRQRCGAAARRRRRQ